MREATILGNIGAPSPRLWHWLGGGAAAIALHALAALPFLPEVDRTATVAPEGQGEEASLEVRLAPIVRPPEQDIPEEVETPPEEVVIEERAADSPPPEPPAQPRLIPDLPQIQPRAIPELWAGSGSGDQLLLEEYLFLKSWLAAARAAVLSEIRYPEDARRRSTTGTAQVTITANRDGTIVSWRFNEATGSPRLDREIERTIGSIRRLPEFPEGTRYETLSYVVTVRFELVQADGTILSANTPAPQAARDTDDAGPDAPPALSVGDLSRCAAAARGLETERASITTERERIEGLITDFNRRAERFQRERRDLPRRLERLRGDINEAVARFDTRVAAFDERAGGYGALCGGGRTSYEAYEQACRPYLAAGNAYCEAFGQFWDRLRR